MRIQDPAKQICVRRLSRADAIALAGRLGTEAAAFPWGIPRPESAEGAESWYAEVCRAEVGQQSRTFAVESHCAGAVGCIRCARFGGDPRTVQISYWIAPGFRGRGYGTAAVRVLCAFLRAQPAVDRVLAYVTEDNFASRRLLLRCGFCITGEVLRARVSGRDGDGAPSLDLVGFEIADIESNPQSKCRQETMWRSRFAPAGSR